MKKVAVALLIVFPLLVSCATGGGRWDEPVILSNVAEASDLVTEILEDLSRNARDPWQKAIYDAGAQDIVLQGDMLSFKLRSYDPGLEDLGAYVTGDVHWLYDLASKVGSYDLKVSFPLADGQYDRTLAKIVKTAATTAKKAFGNENVRQALSDRLFPMPSDSIDDDFISWIENTPEVSNYDADVWAPLFRTQTKQKLDTGGGPYELELRCTGAAPEKLLEFAHKTAYDAFAREGGNSKRTYEEIREGFLAALTQDASTGKASEQYTIPIDLDMLRSEELPAAYAAYLERYVFEDALYELEDAVSFLPDYPAQDFPSNGWLSGTRNGTRVDIQAPDDGLARYIQIRRYADDEVLLAAFLRSGKTCTVNVPQGDCYFLVASGELWFGLEHLFGDLGQYSRTDLLEVASSEYYHVIQLKVKNDGNLGSYRADPAEFLR